MIRATSWLIPALLMAGSASISVSAQPATDTAPPAAAADNIYQPRILSAIEARADVALMRRALETIHPGLYRYASPATIDAAFARLDAAASRPIEELSLYREMALLMATIRCDHSKAELSDRLTAFREQNPTHLPFRFQIIEGRMIVVSAGGQAGAPPVGAEILKINDQPVAKLLRQIAPAVSYDGTTDQAIAVKLGDDSDLMGDDFNEYFPAFYGFVNRWNIHWTEIGSAAVQQTSLTPLTFARWKSLMSPNGDYRAEFYKSIGWRLAGSTARLSIGTFVNYRNPVDPAAFLGGFFRTMKEAGTKRLILDLRGNGGGSDDAQVALVRYLAGSPTIFSKPIRYKTIRYGDLPGFISSWGDTAALFNPPESDFVRTADGWFDRIPVAESNESDGYNPTLQQTPFADRFNGELIILAGPANGSGATRTMALLKEKAGAKIIGEDSSGSAEGPTAGRILLLTLPKSGLKLRIPNAWNRTNISSWTTGKGVAADVLVVPTLADFQAGRDRALAVARTSAPDGDSYVSVAARLSAEIKGVWRGNLDRRDADQRMMEPAGLEANGLSLSLLSGLPHAMTTKNIIRIDPALRSLSLTTQLITTTGRRQRSNSTELTLQISEFRTTPDGNVTLVADGSENARGGTKNVRIILTKDKDHLRITRMDRIAGAPFLLSQGYELTR